MFVTLSRTGKSCSPKSSLSRLSSKKRASICSKRNRGRHSVALAGRGLAGVWEGLGGPGCDSAHCVQLGGEAG